MPEFWESPPPAPVDDATLDMPTARNLAGKLWRAVRMRCPNCGGKGLLESYFEVKDRCPTCHFQLTRGESDYYLGGMMFNMIMAEGLFVIAFLGALWATWPNVPWDAVEWIVATGMIVMPILLYPVSQIVWLAFDLAFRPPTDREQHPDDYPR